MSGGTTGESALGASVSPAAPCAVSEYVSACRFGDVPELRTPWTTAALTSANTHTGASTSSDRRHGTYGNMRRGGGSPSARTRSRRLSGAVVGSARRSRTSSANSFIVHQLLESFQCPAQTRRAGRGTDSQHARRGRPVKVEQHPQGDDLPFGRGQLRECRLERARAKLRVVDGDRVAGVALLAASAALLGAKMIQRVAACDPAEPGPRRPAARIEAPPRPKRLLERLARQVLRDGAVPGQEDEVAVHGVELALRNGRKRRPVDVQAGPGARHRVHGPHTPPPPRTVTSRLS